MQFIMILKNIKKLICFISIEISEEPFLVFEVDTVVDRNDCTVQFFSHFLIYTPIGEFQEHGRIF